jgi:hypothetical protein
MREVDAELLRRAVAIERFFGQAVRKTPSFQSHFDIAIKTINSIDQDRLGTHT